MSTVEGKKQEKRRALLDAAYELFLERGTSKTSVEDITSRAKVGKGTFYLYFADKGSVTQALLARVSYQLLDNACAAAEQHAAELTSFPDQMIFVIDISSKPCARTPDAPLPGAQLCLARAGSDRSQRRGRAADAQGPPDRDVQPRDGGPH